MSVEKRGNHDGDIPRPPSLARMTRVFTVSGPGQDRTDNDCERPASVVGLKSISARLYRNLTVRLESRVILSGGYS